MNNITECYYVVTNENKEREYIFNLTSSSFSLKTKMDFCSFVNSIVFADDTYNPLLKDIAINIGLIKYFTDVNINDIILDEDNKLTLEGIYKFDKYQSTTNLVEVIKYNINEMEYISMINSLENQIEFKTGIRNTDNDINYAICNLIKSLENKLSSLDLDSVLNIGTKLANISDNLTVEKLVEAYSKTDNFKGNQASVVNDKNKVINALQNELIKQL